MWLKPSPGPDTTKLSSGEGQEILVDGVSREEVCSKREEKMPFHHMTTVLPFFCPLRHHSGALLVSGVRRLDPIPRQTLQNWQERGIILGKTGIARMFQVGS